MEQQPIQKINNPSQPSLNTVPFHSHNGADGSPRLNPNNFLGFPNFQVQRTLTPPTDTPYNGTIRFLYQDNYINPNITVTEGLNAGASSATLTTAWPYPTQVLNTTFSDGEVRPITYNFDSTGITWFVDLINDVGANLVLSLYQVPITQWVRLDNEWYNSPLGGTVWFNTGDSFTLSTFPSVSTYPHGLGRIPSVVMIQGALPQYQSVSNGSWTPTFQTCYSTVSLYNGAIVSDTATVILTKSISATPGDSVYLSGQVVCDTTNIYIYWLATGSMPEALGFYTIQYS